MTEPTDTANLRAFKAVNALVRISSLADGNIQQIALDAIATDDRLIGGSVCNEGLDAHRFGYALQPSAPSAEPTAALCDRICQAIKAADDKSTTEAGYMLDSNDCINIVRAQFGALLMANGLTPQAGCKTPDGCRENGCLGWCDDHTPQAATASVAPEPIGVEAVAEVCDTPEGLELRWLIEGGIAALVEGCVLVMPHKPITDDDGHGEVYAAPLMAPTVSAPSAEQHRGLTVKAGADGVWLAFAASTGRHALLNVDRIADSRGSIVSKALRDWAADVQGAAPLMANGPEPIEFSGLPFNEAKARILAMNADDVRGLAISLMIQNSALQKWEKSFLSQPIPETAATASVAGLQRTAGKWEGAEEWMPLAWELCADECGEDACTELVWEGGPVPEPWGDRWLKYEDEAKRLIALVRKHVPVATPQAATVPTVQPLTEAQAKELMAGLNRNLTGFCGWRWLDVIRETERACAAAWNVKLAGIPAAAQPKE